MSIKDRLKIFMEAKSITPARFEKACGLSNGYLRQLRKNPSLDKIEMIISAYPEINKSWLLTGEGEMLIVPSKGGEVVQTNENGDNLYQSEKVEGGAADETLRDVIHRQADQIDRLLSIIERMQGIK